MASEERRVRPASLKRQLRFPHEWRKMVETDPELTPEKQSEWWRWDFLHHPVAR